jgi:hypothetical protein
MSSASAGAIPSAAASSSAPKPGTQSTANAAEIAARARQRGPAAAAKTLGELRNKLAASRDNYVRNTGIQVGPTAASAPTSSRPAALAPEKVREAKAWLRSPEAAKDPRQAATVVSILQRAGAM